MKQSRPTSKVPLLLRLLKVMRNICQYITDSVKRKAKNSLTTCLMISVATFGLKYKSLLQFVQDLHNENHIFNHNLITLYEVKKAPSDTHYREQLGS
jgi:hypothetical protein